MWRSWVCLGVVLGVVGLGLAQDRPTRREVRKGQIIRVIPDRNVIVMRAGTGAEVREVEYRVVPNTKYWGTDKRPLANGLRYQGFREGTEVWFVPGTGEEARVVSELWFFEPVQQVVPEEAAYLEGKVVRVDPVGNVVVVRTPVGTEFKEYEYRVDTATRYWGTDQQPFTTGLRYQGFREGTPIWFRVGPGGANRVLREVRFFNPVPRPAVRPRQP